MKAWCYKHLDIELKVITLTGYNYIESCSGCLADAFDEGQDLGEQFEITWPLIKMAWNDWWLRWKLNHRRKR